MLILHEQQNAARTAVIGYAKVVTTTELTGLKPYGNPALDASMESDDVDRDLGHVAKKVDTQVAHWISVEIGRASCWERVLVQV